MRLFFHLSFSGLQIHFFLLLLFAFFFRYFIIITIIRIDRFVTFFFFSLKYRWLFFHCLFLIHDLVHLLFLYFNLRSHSHKLTYIVKFNRIVMRSRSNNISAMRKSQTLNWKIFLLLMLSDNLNLLVRIESYGPNKPILRSW